MADYNSSLPVRTEGDVDEKLQTKIVDATTPSQQLTVESDGSINVNSSLAPGAEVGITDGTDSLEINADGSINVSDNGGSLTVDATDLDIRDLSASQDNVAISDGTDTLAINADGSVNITDNGGSITVDGTVGVSGTVDVSGSTVTIQEPLSIDDNGGSITVDATDLDVRDLSAAQDNVAISDGTDQLEINTDGSINVNVLDSIPGSEVVDYQTSSAVAKDASVNHDYTVSGGTTFYGKEAWVSGSGKLKVEILVNGSTVFVGFNSTANPNIRIPLEKLVTAAATQVVRLTITNRDNQAQDLYSTLLGEERS